MNACFTTGLMQQFHRLFGVLVLSLFSFQVMATDTPVVVSVDHRVIANFSKPQLDAKKGVYTTEVRIKNRSAAPLLPPLRLTIEQFDGKNVKLLNAHSAGKDGQPYFEFALPKEMLWAGGVTDPVKVVFAVEKSTAKERVSDKKQSLFTYHVSAGVELAPLEPRAEPYALTVDSGKVNVRFSVRLAGKLKFANTVYLRRIGDGKGVAMNDLGKDGDLVAKDGIYGVNIPVDATKIKPDTCLYYEAFINVGHVEVVSTPLILCVSSFPVRAVPSNTDKPVAMPDGSKAVADEILVTTVPNTNAAAIRSLASDIHAKVVGSIPSSNFYQLKLSAPASFASLSELVSQLSARPEVKAASVNAIGHSSYVPSDPEYVNQQGLQLVRAQDVWDAGTTGSGVIVTVLDSGIDRTHPDFGTVGNCQLVGNDCGSPSTDTLGHGTEVAGIIAAKTNNALGIAGVAYGSKIKSIQVSPTAIITLAQMTQGFTDSASYGLASVINASFGGGPWASVDVTTLCAAINSAVLNAGTPVAVVANAAGNSNSNGYFYPARCNVNDPVYHPGQHEQLTRKDLFITVANSASVTSAIDPVCGAAAVDQRCIDSNYGTWVDISAPGSAIRTTAMGGGYASPSGTSFAAPMVAGAAAILRQCGVALDQIEPTLKASANVTVPFPDGSSTKRLDIYRALSSVNHAPTGVGLSNNSILEKTNTSGGYVVGTLSATDVDTCDKFSFSIFSGADMASFSINSATNTLILTAGVLNHVTKPSFAVTVRVTDFFGSTFDQPITVNVLNVNDAPAGTNATVTTNEDTAYTFGAANFGFTDPLDSPPNNLSAVIITTLPAVGQLALSGVPVVAGQSIAAASLGNLTFMPAANANGMGYASFTFQAVDDGGTANGGVNTDPTPNTLTINVTPVNDAPSFVKGADQLVLENAGAQTVPGWATSISAGPADEAAQTLTFNITGNTNSGLFSTQPAISPSGTLTYTPAANTSGTATITVVLMDNGGIANGGVNASAAQTFVITVTAIAMNHPPTITDQTFTHIEYNQVNPGASPPFDNNVGPVIASDPDVGDTLTFSITGGNDAVVNGVLQSNAFAFGAGGQLIVNNPLALNFEYKQVFTLTVQVKDSGNLTATATVTVNLTDDANDNGDPHINTVDGLHYDFQSAGEFVALRGANGMEIQTRHTPVSTAAPIADGYSGLPVGVSINTAVAARVGQHRVTYQMKDNGNSASSGIELRVDGVVTTPMAEGLDLGSGGRLAAAPGGGIQIDFPDGTTMVETPNWWAGNNVWYINIDIFHTADREGIMGARYKGSWLPRLSDGSALGAMPAAMHDRYVELYVKFADSWRVSDSTSLFDYAPDTSTNTFTFREWPKESGPYVIGHGPVAKPVANNVATQLCRGVVGKNDNADCVFDVMVTGDRGMAKAHLLSQQIRTGLTSVIVSDDRRVSRNKEMVTFTATVARHAAAVTRMEIAGKGGTGALTGEVQFTINGNNVGNPVKLDARGQAQLKMPRLKIEKQTIGARYVPVKGTLFFPSNSFESARVMVEGKR